MAKLCVKCGKTVGMLSPEPLDLENGEILCYDCSEIIKSDITKLYGAKTLDAFNEIKENIVNKCKENYNESICLTVCNLIDKIGRESDYLKDYAIKAASTPDSSNTPNVQNTNIATTNYTTNNSSMFSNIGGKIKTLAQVVTLVGIIAFVIIGFVLMATDDDLVLTGFIVAILGALSSWVSSFVLYGFGQLIENTDKLVELSKK